MPPTRLQSITRLFTGSEHCCEWCYERYIKTHHTGLPKDSIPCKRCPYCGAYGCPRALRHWAECPVYNPIDPPAWLMPILEQMLERELEGSRNKRHINKPEPEGDDE
ncbi:hypothetical protein [Bifidobacterium scaligerum]|uniref:Uncharacterized protein n=1 Tax=Bifidobacterium scaligerum TaxID=2052656 RepID=A0A2M9HT49_9BIFI|nr:hypothetical protein [Bifidobacterium scaligerum]PJM79990.1 hypothetical protein CUU80_02320 [Bifidobacterium scaligerum]